MKMFFFVLNDAQRRSVSDVISEKNEKNIIFLRYFHTGGSTLVMMKKQKTLQLLRITENTCLNKQ